MPPLLESEVGQDSSDFDSKKNEKIIFHEFFVWAR
jgi:hypothetical protein